MPYQVQQLIQGRGKPVCVTRDELVEAALTLMIKHDFSQLPVVIEGMDFDMVEGMITYEGILRGVRNFNARIGDLHVRDVMASAQVYGAEDDLFDILDGLKESNAILVTDTQGSRLIGIVTSYDTTEYFRNRTEDLMRVEDIELMLKDFIKAAYMDGLGELNEDQFNTAIARVASHGIDGPPETEKPRSFDDLSLGEYIALLLMKETWPYFEPVFGVQRAHVGEILGGIRKTRNALAHFRGSVSPEERDRLKFAVEWLARCQEVFQVGLEAKRRATITEQLRRHGLISERETVAGPPTAGTSSVEHVAPEITEVEVQSMSQHSEPGSAVISVTDSAAGGGRYDTLADWLQSQPGSIDQVLLTFSEIEAIMKGELPASARGHRAWWANDAEGHTHSQQWLEAGWRTTYVNLTEGRVRFVRVREREKAYIAFFSKLLDELRRTGQMPVRDVSPDGVSWIIVQTLPRQGGQEGAFNFAFSRSKRLRVELYLDMWDQGKTKAVFDRLYAEKEKFEAVTGPIQWERLDSRRASRLAIYHDGQITDDERTLTKLRKWAAETMARFYNALVDDADRAIVEIKYA